MESLKLDAVAVRVLGALMEKEMTTPESYPLSLNGLVAASNQKTSREPVMELGIDQVMSGLDTLEAHALVSSTRDARVPKYEHRIRTVLNLRRDETAVLCLLLLRGPQTVGELRGRSDRMHGFDDIAATQATLDRLAGRETPLVARVAGVREARWVHLLGDGEVPAGMAAPAAGGAGELAGLRERVAGLEARVEVLEARLYAVLPEHESS